MTLIVKRTERGWAGHLIVADMCRFRRNTLLQTDNQAIIVSTVGAYYAPYSKGEPDTIGYERYYETMAFHGINDGPYIDIDVQDQIYFESEWAIDHIDDASDNEANDMHEAVVAEITTRLQAGEQL